MEKTKLIKNIYTNVHSPACFSSIDKVFKEAKRQDPEVTRKDVQNVLESIRTFTIHRRRRNNFKRLKTIPAGFMTHVQVDLADFQKTAEDNQKFKYLLVAVDVFSRRVFVAPVLSKSPKHMKKAFDIVFKKMPALPWIIFSDKGLEFLSHDMKNYFKQKDIRQHIAQSPDVKASVAERFIRTIKERLYKYFTEKATLKWIDVVDDIVLAINKTVSTATGMRPLDVNFENQDKLWEKLYGSTTKASRKNKFNASDDIRIAKTKGTFEKSYLPNYTSDVYSVDRVVKGSPNTYHIKNDAGQEVLGKFYNEELSRTQENNTELWTVEKVLRSRKKKGVKEYFVKWQGKSSKFNSWITNKDLI